MYLSKKSKFKRQLVSPHTKFVALWLFIDEFILTKYSCRTVTGFSIGLVNPSLETQNKSYSKILLCASPITVPVNEVLQNVFVNPMQELAEEGIVVPFREDPTISVVTTTFFPALFAVVGDDPGQRHVSNLGGKGTVHHVYKNEIPSSAREQPVHTRLVGVSRIFEDAETLVREDFPDPLQSNTKSEKDMMIEFAMYEAKRIKKKQESGKYPTTRITTIPCNMSKRYIVPASMRPVRSGSEVKEAWELLKCMEELKSQRSERDSETVKLHRKPGTLTLPELVRFRELDHLPSLTPEINRLENLVPHVFRKAGMIWGESAKLKSFRDRCPLWELLGMADDWPLQFPPCLLHVWNLGILKHMMLWIGHFLGKKFVMATKAILEKSDTNLLHGFQIEPDLCQPIYGSADCGSALTTRSHRGSFWAAFYRGPFSNLLCTQSSKWIKDDTDRERLEKIIRMVKLTKELQSRLYMTSWTNDDCDQLEMLIYRWKLKVFTIFHRFIACQDDKSLTHPSFSIDLRFPKFDILDSFPLMIKMWGPPQAYSTQRFESLYASVKQVIRNSNHRDLIGDLMKRSIIINHPRQLFNKDAESFSEMLTSSKRAKTKLPNVLLNYYSSRFHVTPKMIKHVSIYGKLRIPGFNSVLVSSSDLQSARSGQSRSVICLNTDGRYSLWEVLTIIGFDVVKRKLAPILTNIALFAQELVMEDECANQNILPIDINRVEHSDRVFVSATSQIRSGDIDRVIYAPRRWIPVKHPDGILFPAAMVEGLYPQQKGEIRWKVFSGTIKFIKRNPVEQTT